MCGGGALLMLLTCFSDWELGSSIFDFRDYKDLLGSQKDLPDEQTDA